MAWKRLIFIINNLLVCMKFSRNIFSNVLITEWRWGDSNPWPPACKAGALPTELHPQILRIRLGFPYTFGSLFFYPFLYSRKSWAWEDSNFRPHAYQACALTGWATSPYRLSAFQASIRSLWQPLFYLIIHSSVISVRYRNSPWMFHFF